MKQVFQLPVVPVAKARPRVVRLKNGASSTFTPDKTVDCEERIKWHLRCLGASQYAAGVALKVSVTFAVRKPKSKQKSRAPVTRPDLDQYCKLLLDAGNGMLWTDDSQIVNLQAVKVYAEEEPYILLEVEEL